MDWLNSNWIWLLLGFGALWLFMGKGGMGGCGSRSQRSAREHHDGNDDQMPLRDDSASSDTSNSTHSQAVAQARLDPVSGNPVRTDRALTAFFEGQPYYFESEETRRRFEAEPQKYATAAPPPQEHQRHRHHGC